MDENKYSELLTYYLDGELDPSLEPGLFAELSNNSELQAEMDDYMAIRNSIQSETEAAFVPADATEAVFSAIGFNIPDTVTVEVSPTNAKISKSYIKYAAALFFIGLVSYLFVSNTDKDEKIDNLQKQITALSDMINNNVSIDVNAPKGESFAVPTNANQNVPVMTSEENHNSNINSYKSNQYNNKNSIDKELAKVTDNTNINSIHQGNDGFILPISMVSTHSAQFNHNINSFQSEKMPFSINKHINLNPIGNTEGNYSIYLRGITHGAFPSSRVEPRAEPVFSYMSFGIFRTFRSLVSEDGIIEDLKFGIDFGQEPFYQQFYARRSDHTNVVVQNPMIFWCAVACRVEFKSADYMYEIKPYSQIEIGGTNMGPLAKAQVGLQYNISNAIGLNVGLEGSSLLFYNKPEWYSSEKFNVVYGMSIKF